MHTHQLKVHQWAAFSPDRREPGEWVAWALGQSQATTGSSGSYKPDLPDVPAMLRRRLSGMGKAALWCAGQVLSANTRAEPATSIFCSQHGEVSRTVALLKELARYSPLSPASFSLSVHNAIGGIHSIAGEIQHPVTAIAAGPDSPFAALLEAWSQLKFRQLKSGVSDLALVVIYDDALPADVTDRDDRPGQVQAMALLVSCEEAGNSGDNGDGGLTLSFSLSGGPDVEGGATAEAAIDTLLKFMLDVAACNMVFQSDGRRWCWSKQPGALSQVPL